MANKKGLGKYGWGTGRLKIMRAVLMREKYEAGNAL